MTPEFKGWTGFGWAMAAAAAVIVINGKATRMSAQSGGNFRGLENLVQ